MLIDYLDIGTRIKKERIKQGLTQEELANIIGCGVAHISHIETGNSSPSLKSFIAIVNTLNVSADELLCDQLEKSIHVYEGELAAIMKDCTDDEIKIITDVVKTLKKSLRKKRRTSKQKKRKK